MQCCGWMCENEGTYPVRGQTDNHEMASLLACFKHYMMFEELEVFLIKGGL